MFDLIGYTVSELFKIRDAIAILAGYGLQDVDLEIAVNIELDKRHKEGGCL